MSFTKPEVIDKLRRIGLKLPDWEVLFEELDVDGSGELDWDELHDGMLGFWQNRDKETQNKRGESKAVPEEVKSPSMTRKSLFGRGRPSRLPNLNLASLKSQPD